jgi:hypothetical protein
MVSAISSMQSSRQSGIVLVTVLLLLALFTGVAVATVYTVTSAIEGSGYTAAELGRVHRADGGVATVYGYLAAYGVPMGHIVFDENAFPPQVIAPSTGSYSANVSGVEVVRDLPGFSEPWRGYNVRIQSTVDSGRDNRDYAVVVASVVEAGTFIGVEPVGYSNE